MSDDKKESRVEEYSSDEKAEERGYARGQRRKHLTERLKLLHQRAMMIEDELKALDDDRFYRVCIFGSARIKPETPAYEDAFALARMLAWEGIDILTGGGPGLMEAANKGALLGREEKKTKALSYGLSIELDFEPEPNSHLDIKRHHHKFSSRLDEFMMLSHSIIATPGGIGTLLELYFAWQLIQVRHMSFRPLVLMDRAYWTGLIDWMKEYQLGRGLVSAENFDCIHIVDTPEEVVEIISKHHKQLREKNITE
ncbi:MAG: LOG family protein [Bdellovibrionales bacterium]|nr:LOG family protein [Bdellovibrionales bacterium]